MLAEIVELFDSFGFVLYYTIGMALLGGIVTGGFYSRLMWRFEGKRGFLNEILLAWFAGVFLFGGMTSNLAVFVAVGLRVVLEAVFIFVSKASGLRMKTTHAPVVFFCLLVLGVLLASTLWNPPTVMNMLGVDRVEMAAPQVLQDGDVQDITYDDLKDIRIVSQEYAAQLPRTELVETGYDVAGSRGTVDVYPAGGMLRWISVYEPTILLKKGEPSPYYVTINAMNPGERQKVKAEIKYSERDPLWSTLVSREVLNTYLRLMLAHPAYIYGDGYYVPELNSWIYPYGIYDYNVFPLTFVYKQVGVAVIGPDGEVALHKFGSIPAELKGYLLLEEQYAEERMAAWAQYNGWKDPIDYHFRQPNVFEPAEDIFYQYDAGTGRFYALAQFEPAGEDRKSIVSWAEIAANGDGVGSVKMYDARDLGLIGPVKATSIIESEVSQYSKAGYSWVVFQPQFKYLRGRYVYVAPIYAGEGVSITIKGVGVVDAKTERVKVLFWKDVVMGAPEAEAGQEAQTAQAAMPAGCEKIYSTDKQEFYACPTTLFRPE